MPLSKRRLPPVRETIDDVDAPRAPSTIPTLPLTATIFVAAACSFMLALVAGGLAFMMMLRTF